MIVPMKKLSLLLYHREKESFLKFLQELGVVHVVEHPDIRSENLETLQNQVKAADRVLKALKSVSREKKITAAQSTQGNAEEIVVQFDDLDTKREKIDQQIGSFKKDINALEPWGDFEPDSVKRLEEAAITMRFFTANDKKFNALTQENLQYEIINKIGSTVYFVFLERGERITLDAEEIILPKISLSEARNKVEALLGRKQEIEQELEKLVIFQDIFKFYLSNQRSHLSLESARLSMEEAAEGRVLSVTGWIPAEKEKMVGEFLDGFSGWYEFVEPSPDENVPVLLKNRKTSALFEAITKIFVLPDYFEIDPTPFFAPFFAMFFGLCLGDSGYGLIIFIASIVAIKKGSASLKPIFQLGMILGIATMIAGLLLNTFFGMAIFTLPGYENALFSRGSRLAMLGSVETERGTYFPAMTFSLYVGIMQILLGMGIQAANNIKNNSFVYGIAPFANMVMVCAFTIFLVHDNFMDMGMYTFGIVPIGKLISEIPVNTSLYLAVIGVILLLLFNNPSKKIPVRIGLGLWELYNFVSGVVSNGLSYLRLFALGLAGGLLGAAFNEIALMLITNENGVVNYASFMTVFTVLILLVGHTLNLGLSALGAFVHSLRLTFVEFYGNVGFKGSGKPYSPLSQS